MKKHLLVLLLFFSTTTLAEKFEGWVQLHGPSKHANSCETCNEMNIGAGYIGTNQVSFVGGYYKNSWFQDSFYAGVNVKYNKYLSFSAVGITGYSNTNIDNDVLLFEEVLPAMMTHVIFMPDRMLSPMLSYAPAPDGGVILLSLNMKYKMERPNIFARIKRRQT